MPDRSLVDSLFGSRPSAVSAPKRRNARPEAKIARGLVRVCKAAGVHCERRTVGFDRERSIAYGTKGEPDHALAWRGRACRVEEKAPGSGRLSDHQLRWIDRHAEHVPTFIIDNDAGARRVIELLTGPVWPVPGADLRGLR